MKKLLFFFLLIMLIACKENHKETLATIENFEEFNEHFHSDSLFQISRIHFPIKGEFADGFDQHKWTKDNWKILATPVSRTNPSPEEYEHDFFKNDTMVIEKYWIDNSGFSVERNFKLIDGKWFLVYYNDINL